ncbi:MAG: hypothetical protein CO128_02325 [Ignavibacteriales bacterium CG_4_9_14_3_um_filter_30_11]|nr:MAG: hypothetical protein CO128_02325 [Ignavibacteriales bacterium CG_4_9_14_3_um_filter_30_11]
MDKISEIIKLKKNGLFYYNRIILPFEGYLLKVIIDDEIITDFSTTSKYAYVKEEDGFMNIYFKEFKNLSEIISKYEAIKIVIVEKGKDIFNMKNHRKLALYLEENHVLKIEATDDDILFIE